METAEIIWTSITMISTVVALWQIKARLNIQKMLQQESLHLHSSVALVLGNCQNTISNIQKNMIPDALVSSGQAEGGTQMLLKQTVKIICHYHNPTDNDIGNWVKRGKISENYKPMFMAHSEKNIGLLRSAYKFIIEKIY